MSNQIIVARLNLMNIISKLKGKIEEIKDAILVLLKSQARRREGVSPKGEQRKIVKWKSSVREIVFQKQRSAANDL